MDYAAAYPVIAAEAPAEARTTFIRRTYAHLAGAILAFTGLEALLLNLPIGDQIIGLMFSSQVSWLVVLAAFMAVSWVADRWARSDMPSAMQYLGLALYVAAEAVIFLPLIWYAVNILGEPQLISKAAILTLSLFVGLSFAVLWTGHDYSFLWSALKIGGFVAMGFIVCSILFGFSLGLWFTLAMIAFACGAIIYHTSNVLHHYRTDQHVAASLALFAAIALLFWYILRLVISQRD